MTSFQATTKEARKLYGLLHKRPDMKCILARCNKTIPPARHRFRTAVTCSEACGKIHNQNGQTRLRAKKAGSETAVCKLCSKLILVDTRKDGFCMTCKKGDKESVKLQDLVISDGKKYSVAEILDQPVVRKEKHYSLDREVISGSPVTDTGYVMNRTRVYLGENWEKV